MFSISCFEGSTCLANVVIGTVITFKFVNTCGCVFFTFGVACGFVCEVSFQGVVCGVCCVVFSFLILLAIFLCGFVVMCFLILSCDDPQLIESLIKNAKRRKLQTNKKETHTDKKFIILTHHNKSTQNIKTGIQHSIHHKQHPQKTPHKQNHTQHQT